MARRGPRRPDRFAQKNAMKRRGFRIRDLPSPRRIDPRNARRRGRNPENSARERESTLEQRAKRRRRLFRGRNRIPAIPRVNTVRQDRGQADVGRQQEGSFDAASRQHSPGEPTEVRNEAHRRALHAEYWAMPRLRNALVGWAGHRRTPFALFVSWFLSGRPRISGAAT